MRVMPHPGEALPGRINPRSHQENAPHYLQPRGIEQADLRDSQLKQKAAFLEQWGVDSVEQAAVQEEIRARASADAVRKQIQEQNPWGETTELPVRPTGKASVRGPRPQLSGDQIGRMAQLQNSGKPQGLKEKFVDFWRNIIG